MKETRSLTKRAAIMALVVVTALSMLCTFGTNFATQKVYAAEEIELVDSWGGDPGDAVAIAEGDTKNVNLTDEKAVETFVFTPETSGTYIFSADSEEDLDTEGQALDADGIQIAHNDDRAGSTHFGVVFDAVAGETYYLQASLWGQETPSAEVAFTVTLAESDVIAVSYDCEGEITFTENVGGEECGEGDDTYYYYDFYDTLFRNGAVITVTHKGGNEVAYAYDSDEDAFISEEGETLRGLKIDSSQEEAHWVAGGENYIYLTYMGKKLSIPVSIVANTVASIAYQPAGEIVFYENTNGYWDDDSDWNEYYHYETWNLRQDGDVLTVTDTEGATVAYTYDAEERVYVAEGGATIDRSEVSFTDDQNTNHWTAGGQYTVNAEYMDKTAAIPVKVQQNPVAAISLTLKSNNIVENTCGGWSTDDDDAEFYCYTVREILAAGATLNVEDAEGNVTAYVYNADDEQYVAANGDVISGDDVEVEFDYNDQYDNHWAAGDTKQINVAYNGRTANFNINIVAEGSHDDQEDQQKAAAVEELIAAIPDNVTLADEQTVAAAKEAYDALTETQQNLVDDDAWQKLKDAVDKIEELKEGQQGEDDQQKANAVAELISALNDNITLADESAVAAAEAAYNNLTDDQRNLISSDLREKLNNAIDRINELKDEQQGTDDQKKADDVTALIKKLNDKITLADESAVMATKKAYDALTNEQKALVDKGAKTKLEEAVKRINYLNADQEFKAKKAAAKKIKVKNFKVTAKTGRKAKATWKVAKGVSGYEIRYSLKKNFSKAKKVNVKSGAAKKATIKKLKANKKYFVKIRAYTSLKNASGKTVKVYGRWSKAVKMTAKK